jgi:hypothetical protein
VPYRHTFVRLRARAADDILSTVRRWIVFCFLAFALCAPAGAQSLQGLVIDPVGLPLPGVHLTLIRDEHAIAVAASTGDGTFEFSTIGPDDLIEAALYGFETTRVRATGVLRIVLPLARAAARSEVTAPLLADAGATSERLGGTLTAATARGLPSSRQKIIESLPLLPSVMRGPDGLLRIDGTRPHEAALWIDGFDVTDPVTGSSTIDLPLEVIKGASVLRDPMAATFGGTLGAIVSIDTVGGGDSFSAGVQEFVPEPRLSGDGFGHIEGFFPRIYAGGRVRAVRYFAAHEFDLERVVVPGVTSRAGSPTTGHLANTSFARIDIGISPRHTMTVEGFEAPSRTAHAGLSPLRDAAAAPLIRSADAFAGVIDRLVVGARDVLTLRFAATRHRTAFRSAGTQPARLTPAGWRDNTAGSLDRSASRQSIAVSWDRAGIQWLGRHGLDVTGEMQRRSMDARVEQQSLRIEDAAGQVVRLIEFAPSEGFARRDAAGDLLVRDAWDVNHRVQLDIGARIDWYNRQAVASPRLGIRAALDQSGATVLKAGFGRFVGRVPLGALAFDAFPARRDTSFGASTAIVESVQTRELALTPMQLPRADTAMIEVDRHIEPGLDLQFEARRRIGSRLPTVNVPSAGGVVTLASTGGSAYREVAVAARQLWGDTAQAFVSYVHSMNRTELNDYGSLFANMMAPQLEPGLRTRSGDDVPNRIVAWGTAPLPSRIVIAPAIEWRTGFPYASVDSFRRYAGAPNTGRFPAFMALDVLAYRTFDIHHRLVDLGAQIFNVTRHFNPRDVRPVNTTPYVDRFTNSVGVTVDGYMMVRWD